MATLVKSPEQAHQSLASLGPVSMYNTSIVIVLVTKSSVYIAYFYCSTWVYTKLQLSGIGNCYCYPVLFLPNVIPANHSGMAGIVLEEWLLSRLCPGKTPVPEFCISGCYLVCPRNKTKSGLCIYWCMPFKSNRVKYNSLPLEFLLDLHARWHKL